MGKSILNIQRFAKENQEDATRSLAAVRCTGQPVLAME